MNRHSAIEEDIFGNPSEKLLFAKNGDDDDDEKILGIAVNSNKNIMNMCIHDAVLACCLCIYGGCCCWYDRYIMNKTEIFVFTDKRIHVDIYWLYGHWMACATRVCARRYVW